MTRFLNAATKFLAGIWVPRSWACACAFAIALAVPACHDKGTRAGDRCTTFDDCRPPLVCSNRFAEAGVMGICVHPEALTDAAVPDAAVPDDAVPTVDGSTPDAGIEPDGETTDASPTQ